MGYFSKRNLAARGEHLVQVMEKSIGPSSTCDLSPSWGLTAYVPPKPATRASRQTATRSFEWLHIAA